MFSRDEVLTHWCRTARIGMTYEESAKMLGISKEALKRAICRARRDGDERAIYHTPMR